jgi:hypothetical protein
MKPLPGSKATIALTFGFLIAVSQPAPPLGVGEQDRRADLLKQRRHGVRDHAGIVGAGVGHDRAEELLQGLRTALKLDLVEVVRPLAEPELVEEELIVGHRLEGRRDAAVAGASPARLVSQIDREAAAQEQGLEALASVRGGLPATGGLESAVQHARWARPWGSAAPGRRRRGGRRGSSARRPSACCCRSVQGVAPRSRPRRSCPGPGSARGRGALPGRSAWLAQPVSKVVMAMAVVSRIRVGFMFKLSMRRQALA